MTLGGICHQHAGAAGDGDDAEPVGLGEDAARRGINHVQHLLGGLGAVHAELPQRRVVDDVGSGE